MVCKNFSLNEFITRISELAGSFRFSWGTLVVLTCSYVSYHKVKTVARIIISWFLYQQWNVTKSFIVCVVRYFPEVSREKSRFLVLTAFTALWSWSADKNVLQQGMMTITLFLLDNAWLRVQLNCNFFQNLHKNWVRSLLGEER